MSASSRFRGNLNPIHYLCLAALLAIGSPGFAQEEAESTSIPLPLPVDDGEQGVSVNMPGMNVADALRMMAQGAGMNLVVDKDVTGVVDLLLQNVSMDEAWDTLLQSAGLTTERRGDVTRVFPKQEETAPPLAMETRLIQLKFVSLVPPTLSGRSGLQASGSSGGSGRTGGAESGTREPSSGLGIASQLGGGDQQSEPDETTIADILRTTFDEQDLRIASDVRGNRLVLTGPTEIVNAAEQLVEALDQPVPQILIQAQIVQVRSSALDQLGIDWGGVYSVRSSATADFEGSRERRDPGNILSGVVDRELAWSSELAEFDVTLAALADTGDAQILSSPRVVTQNNMEAYIASGQEIQIPSGLDINGNASFRERQVTLELGVTPRVLNDSLVSLVIRVRNDRINFEQQEISGVPPLDISTVESFVTLHDRDTVVIGGILSTQETESETRIPFLSDLPFLGKAFRHTRKRTEESELIVLISPAIISDEVGAPAQNAHPGMIPSPAQQGVLDQAAGKDQE